MPSFFARPMSSSYLRAASSDHQRDVSFRADLLLPGYARACRVMVQGEVCATGVVRAACGMVLSGRGGCPGRESARRQHGRGGGAEVATIVTAVLRS